MNMYEPRVGIRWDPTLTHDGRRGVIRLYGTAYSHLRIFVETGTNDGETALAVHDLFDLTYTVEIGTHIHARNAPMFAKYSDINDLLGDSKVIIPKILDTHPNQPMLFWLDGHFCGDARGDEDTPVMTELTYILASGIPHVILVDDSRLFGRDPGYPTLEWVRELATSQNIRYDFSLVDDIIRLVPYEA